MKTYYKPKSVVTQKNDLLDEYCLWHSSAKE